MSKSWVRSRWIFLFLLTWLIPWQEALALTRTFPGAAPCNTTLESCVIGAIAGDTIEIATNNRIHESLTINKSLTLTAAAGFSPVIGNADLASPSPDSIEVEDAGATGGSVSVVLNQINFDGAVVTVLFDEDSGHHFEIRDCQVTNDTPGSGGAAVFLNIQIPSTMSILNNSFAAPGHPILLSSNASGEVALNIQRNTLTTLTRANSEGGIHLDAGGSETFTANVFNNVIFGTSGCNCGEPSAIHVTSRNSADATVNLYNNTIDRSLDPLGASGISLDRVDTSLLTANIFNNIISNSDFGMKIFGLSVDPDRTINNGFNNFFNNTTADPIFVPGPGTQAVDPLYQNPASGNYRLQTASTLIDLGLNNPPGGLPNLDADKLARIVGSKVDMGAFEVQADLSLANAVSPTTVQVGENLTYTLNVTNDGPYDSASVTVTGASPAGTTFVSASPSQGTCGSTTSLACDLGAMNQGDSATITLVLTANQEGTLTHTASVVSTTPDPDSSNDTASVDATVTPASSGGGCSLQRNLRKETNPIMFVFLSVPLLYSLFSFSRRFRQRS